MRMARERPRPPPEAPQVEAHGFHGEPGFGRVHAQHAEAAPPERGEQRREPRLVHRRLEHAERGEVAAVAGQRLEPLGRGARRRAMLDAGGSRRRTSSSSSAAERMRRAA